MRVAAGDESKSHVCESSAVSRRDTLAERTASAALGSVSCVARRPPVERAGSAGHRPAEGVFGFGAIPQRPLSIPADRKGPEDGHPPHTELVPGRALGRLNLNA
jgi:hypothetical protein